MFKVDILLQSKAFSSEVFVANVVVQYLKLPLAEVLAWSKFQLDLLAGEVEECNNRTNSVH